MSLRGNSTFDNFILALIITVLAIIIISPLISSHLYSSIADKLGWKPLYIADETQSFVTQVPWWWTAVSVVILFLGVFIAINGFTLN